MQLSVVWNSPFSIFWVMFVRFMQFVTYWNENKDIIIIIVELIKQTSSWQLPQRQNDCFRSSVLAESILIFLKSCFHHPIHSFLNHITGVLMHVLSVSGSFQKSRHFNGSKVSATPEFSSQNPKEYFLFYTSSFKLRNIWHFLISNKRFVEWSRTFEEETKNKIQWVIQQWGGSSWSQLL